ncbi:transposase [Streptomyces sp. NPDC048415]
MIDGIRFRTRTGIPWRDVPERYGPWGRVYDLFPPLAAGRHLAEHPC